ncbi:stage II sporulation protein M [Alkalithermobacter paradoxus]|uniref:Stage II sporulation protein M n=1 Tax=Alkalithermobacter paradoxus TaxID=29349 RepID=A0A1V4IAP9_9FIRM|nr:hypothetical protein CLOTH_02460 [[Clostridium] thermoalcaliphilum]
MRKINGFSSFKFNYKIFVVFIIFILTLGVSSGVYLNKIYPESINSITEYISRTSNYYSNTDYSVFELVFLNLKNDFLYLSSLFILSLGVITWPLTFLAIFLKGLSIGFTINTLVLGFNPGYIKIIFLILVKNIVIIPLSIVIMIITFSYVLEFLSNFKLFRKFKNNNHMKRLIVKCSVNTMSVVVPTVLIQSILNAVSIFLLQRIF